MGKRKGWSSGGALETEMGKGAVRLSHLVGIVALLDRTPLPRGGVLQLISKGVLQRDALALEREGDEPAHGQRELAAGLHFHRHLIGGATDAAALHLEAGLHVV